MEVQRAKEHYQGKTGARLNCAQSIAAAFGEDTAPFAGSGSGRAPEGWCGAAYAAAEITGERARIEQTFLEAAGTVTCAGIRRSRAMSCLTCIETSARLVQQTRALKNSETSTSPLF
jgi:hypothetical protein